MCDHTVRGSLVFGDETGFPFLPNFKRTEIWTKNLESVDAYSAFTGDTFINVEISAQLLLAGEIRDRLDQMPGLQQSLEALWTPGADSNTAGLPYFITDIGFDHSATLPIIDPTAYLLFFYWKFNPWSPEKKCADC